MFLFTKNLFIDACDYLFNVFVFFIYLYFHFFISLLLYNKNVKKEIYERKDQYENFLEAGESMLDVEIDITSDMSELKSDLDDVIRRWDTLCSNLEKCLNRLKLAKVAFFNFLLYVFEILRKSGATKLHHFLMEIAVVFN